MKYLRHRWDNPDNYYAHQRYQASINRIIGTILYLLLAYAFYSELFTCINCHTKLDFTFMAVIALITPYCILLGGYIVWLILTKGFAEIIWWFKGYD